MLRRHLLAWTALVALATPLAAVQDRTIPFTPGMVIDRSARIRPGTYRVPPNAADRPAITILGANVAVNMNGVTIEGGAPFADPDSFAGTGVSIEGSNITLEGGAVRGFKVAIIARRTSRLHLSRLDLSYNWKPRLLSGIEQEDQSDWLSFHNNETDEWLRYGAAIYLADVTGAEIDHVRAVQGMNGLMATRSSSLNIWNNMFSYLSGVGIGLYRTSDSRIMHNRVDWCVRGYSHGFYNRGQDSTAILLYEQSSRNVVAYNSFTHGGDGVFLWAGQSTMDTGQGGANDNLFYDNDVSHAVANGIEATFSRNVFSRNRIDDCWHGLWGGYSFDSVISHNTFAGNDEAIAIEHGQNIRIVGNRITGGTVGIRLWANATQDPNWGYPKTRDTRSRDYYIADNTIDGVGTGIQGSRTSGIRFAGGRMTNVGRTYLWGDGVPDISIVDRFRPGPAEDVIAPPERFPNAIDAKLPADAKRGRGTIIVDEWGPYDYLSPKLWPAGRAGDRPLKLRALGPPGRWTLAAIRGASMPERTGPVPGEIALTPLDPAIDFQIDLEYVGERVVTPRGEVVPAGRPFRFGYTMFEPAIDWTVRFWKFSAESDPLSQPAAFAALLKTTAVRTERLPRLAYANARSFGEGFMTLVGIIATGSFTLLPGSYELVVTSDDGIRVWLDDKLALEDWTIHGPKDDRLPIAAGRHELRLEYFQNTGAAALQVKIVRR